MFLIDLSVTVLFSIQLEDARQEASSALSRLKDVESQLTVMKERCARQEDEMLKKSSKFQGSYHQFRVSYTCTLISDSLLMHKINRFYDGVEARTSEIHDCSDYLVSCKA